MSYCDPSFAIVPAGECLSETNALASLEQPAAEPLMQNRLLARLPPHDFALLKEHLEPLDCPRGMMIAESGEPIPFAYFPESGVVSVVAESPEGQRVEAGIVGREGFVHPALVLGSDRVPNDIQVQLAGAGHRIGYKKLLKAVDDSAALQETLLLFSQANTVQISFTTLSNAVHQIDERLARWLLMCHDRSESDDLALTHEFMGVMLAVRRPSVTSTLHILEGNGLIELARGFVIIKNRTALEDFAGDAYGKAEAEYRRLLGPI